MTLCFNVGDINEIQLDDVLEGEDTQSGTAVDGEDDNTCTTSTNPDPQQFEGNKGNTNLVVYILSFLHVIIIQKLFLTRL